MAIDFTKQASGNVLVNVNGIIESYSPGAVISNTGSESENQVTISSNIGTGRSFEKFSFNYTEVTTVGLTGLSKNDFITKLSDDYFFVSSGGGGGGATEAKQDDIITALSDVNTELDLQATEAKQDDIITAITDSAPSQSTFGSITTVTAGDTSTAIFSTNTNRKGVIIANEAGENCWLAFGTPAEVEKGIKLKKNAVFIMDSLLLTGQAINAICKSGKSTDLHSQEAV